MVNLEDRIKAITTSVRKVIPFAVVPGGVEAISFTFLDKAAGAWAVA